MIYVVGSGPSGVSCASALLDRGLDVCMLDAGLTLEAPIQDSIDRLASRPPEEWKTADVTPLKKNVEARTDGLPQKVAFGSNFPYREALDFFPTKLDGVHIL